MHFNLVLPVPFSFFTGELGCLKLLDRPHAGIGGVGWRRCQALLVAGSWEHGDVFLPPDSNTRLGSRPWSA